MYRHVEDIVQLCWKVKDMGNALFGYELVDREKKTWREHNIQFDQHSRVASLPIVDQFKNGEKIYLSFIEIFWCGIFYKHWFITNLTLFLEFEHPASDIYETKVMINRDSHSQYPTEGPAKFCAMNELIRARMIHVLGMCNYSLCLRNSEHVANYVFHGHWVSSQMSTDGALMRRFQKYLTRENMFLNVNVFPGYIQPRLLEDSATDKVYSFIDSNFRATSIDCFLDYKKETYNVLMIGPTGAGKSRLINVLFNQQICEESMSHRSVTREIYFVRGFGTVYNSLTNVRENKEIVVADSIGLCDTEWEESEVHCLIKERISANYKFIDLVYIVFRADRLLKHHVKNIEKFLNWLSCDYRNSQRIQFVATHADFLTETQIHQLSSEVVDIFHLKPTAAIQANSRNLKQQDYDIKKSSERTSTAKFINSEDAFSEQLLAPVEESCSIMYIGFPPEDNLNEKTAAKVKASYHSFRGAILKQIDGERIEIGKGFCNIL